MSAPPSSVSHLRFALPPWGDADPCRLELEQRIPDDHLARHVEEVVSLIDLSALFDAYAGTGSLPYPPDLLLRAVLYEVRRGHHSPAAWYRDARESGPLRWLLRGCAPARSCWYAFRDRIAPLLDGFNRQVLHAAVAQGLTPASRGALDGTAVSANASRHRLIDETTLTKRLAQLESGATDEKARAWRAPTPTGRERQRRRLEHAKGYLAARQAANRARKRTKQQPPDRVRINPSDPEAAIGRDKDGVYRPLYNVQLIDDLDSSFVLGYEVLTQPTDAGAVGPLLARVVDLVGRQLQVVLADTAYTGGPDLAAAKAAGVRLYGPLAKPGARADKQIPKSEFRWLPDEGVYVCPQGHRLEYEMSGRNKRTGAGSTLMHTYRCPAEHCQGCPLAARCTPRPDKGRTVARSEYDDEVDELRLRMETAEGKELYRHRCQTVELVNADWKEHWKLRRFSGRGLMRARCEVALVVLAQNLRALLMEAKKNTRVGLPLAPPDEEVA
jgi:transposase